ncbi:MAG: hypothetical protein ACTSVV_00120 [Promethearchaeota archaeon]
MRLNAYRIPSKAFFLGIIISNEVSFKNPVEFLIDTGAVNTTISGYYFDNNFDFSRLTEGERVIGIGGFLKTYLIHNVRLYLYTRLKKWFLVKKFDKISVLPKQYNPETGELIEIPCLLGLDVIGALYELSFGKRKVFLED